MRAVKNNLPTPSREVEESEGPRWTRAVGIIPATPFYSDRSLRPWLGQGAFQGEESALADSGREGEIPARVRLFNETESHDLKTKQEGGGFDPPPS